MSTPSLDDVGIDGPHDDAPRCAKCGCELRMSAFESIGDKDYCFYCYVEETEEEEL